MVYKIFSLLFFLILLTGCFNEKECEEIIDEVYVYPLDTARGKTFEQRIEMFKIPEQTLHCLSTRALLESCLDYPEMRLIWTRNNLQKGFDDVKSWCNGLGELLNRKNKFQELFALYGEKKFTREWINYTDLENGRYMDSIVRVELIISQYEILKGLTKTEKIELFQQVLDNQKQKDTLVQYWGTVGMQTTCAILSRVMYLDNYPPIIEEFNNNEFMLILNDNILLLDSDMVNDLMSISDEYLKTIKKK